MIYSFEIIYYDPTYQTLQNFLCLDNNKLDKFENFGLESCKRFVLMNFDINKLNILNTKDEIKIDKKYKEGSFLITIHRKKIEKKCNEFLEIKKEKKKNL